ncbi:hypothetical protein D3C80_1482610 [compost metagenome]
MVGRHAIEKLAGVAPQLFALLIDTDQVGQTHVEADLQRQQITATAIALPARGQALRPVDALARCRQQGFKAGEHGFGALQKSVQTRVHKTSSRQVQGQKHS